MSGDIRGENGQVLFCSFFYTFLAGVFIDNSNKSGYNEASIYNIIIEYEYHK